jgi:hypothetical protein
MRLLDQKRQREQHEDNTGRLNQERALEVQADPQHQIGLGRSDQLGRERLPYLR